MAEERRTLGLAIIALARETQRGCDCEYDHQCGRCTMILAIHELVRQLDALED